MEHTRFDLIDHNAKIFFAPKLADYYAGEPLSAAEAMTLIKYREAYAGKTVLDVGVGSGRTTRYILPFATSYLGIDVSPPMLAFCQERWPSAEVRELDIRDLATLAPRRFDFIFASNAVLDVLTHEARLQALADCAALLAPQGYFVFSGHNRRYRKAGLPPMLELSGSAIRWPWAAASFIRHRLHHQKMKTFEHRDDDYALLNDIAHGWQGIFYYTDRATQMRQIADTGLSLVECIGADGRSILEGDDDRQDALLHYICRKS